MPAAAPEDAGRFIGPDLNPANHEFRRQVRVVKTFAARRLIAENSATAPTPTVCVPQSDQPVLEVLAGLFRLATDSPQLTPARRGRVVIDCVARWLPAGERGRWLEEWRGEWIEIGEQPVGRRVGYLLRLALRSAPVLGLTLRFDARREQV